MRKVFTVAWREFRDTAMTKAFIFGAIIMPVITIGLFVTIIPLLDSEDEPLTGVIAIQAPDDVADEIESLMQDAAHPLQEQLDQLPDIVTNDPIAKNMLPQATETDLVYERIPMDAEFDEKTLAEEGYVAFVSVPETLLTPKSGANTLEIIVPTHLSVDHTDFLTRNTETAVVNARLKRQGHQPDAMRDLLKRPNAIAMRIQEDGNVESDNEIARTILPIAFMMLLWTAAFTSGNYLLTTTIEEKSNKVIEVLLSAISPMQLLGGKIIGQAGVSTVILAMYGSAAIIGLLTFALFDIVSISQLILFIVYFIMGYFMIATMMVAVGSAVSELSDAQSLMGPMMIMLMIPFFLWPIITDHPHGTVAIATSYIPPLTPFIMIIRMATTTEPLMLWEILLSIGVGYLAVIAMVWMSARIFRIGILMQGKPPNLWQLLLWVKRG